jgi:hypothetical protein
MGGGSPATITVPDYGAYNNQFNLQKSAIEQSMSGANQQMQQKLNAAIAEQQGALTKEVDQKKLLAENTSAQAARLAQLMGPPPPEKTAQAPVIGTSRGQSSVKGKAGLRIDRATATSSAPGAGLNIT